MSVVFFDIDGTLLSGPSSERRFAWYLFRKGVVRLPQLLAYLFFTLKYSAVFGKQVLKKNKAYLKGLDVDEVEILAQQFVNQVLADYLRPNVVNRLNQHRRAGNMIVLLSGTLKPVAEALSDRLDAQHYIATVCSLRNDNNYEARPPTIHPFGKQKLELARQYCQTNSFKLDEAIAYGDSLPDVYLLAAVGHAVVVEPGRKLEQLAMDKGWEIITRESFHTHAAVSG
jgi:HAD superfamily hydrolase (TIGR01490 family)